jgi:cell division protein FtsQ
MQPKATLAALFATAALSAVGYGVYSATRSPLFTVRVVEVADEPEDAPIDAHAIAELARIPVGQVSLFDLDLASVEQRILSHPWVREVRLLKRFPQTVTVSVTFRDPKALLQRQNGSLSYVDEDGHVFGQVDLASSRSDLPVFSGFHPDDLARLREALSLLTRWESAGLGKKSSISSISWHPDRGFRALVTYPVSSGRGRTMVDLGQEIDADPEFPSQLGRLSHVFGYLSQHGVAARQIWADTGKKIVVRIAHGS